MTFKNWVKLAESVKDGELNRILDRISNGEDLTDNEKKFLAAMQGVDLDEASGKKEEDPWEAMKARVAAQTTGVGNGDPNDITALQGVRAQQTGFGIGMGLDYQVVSK
jgi:hypothetical protein